MHANWFRKKKNKAAILAFTLIIVALGLKVWFFLCSSTKVQANKTKTVSPERVGLTTSEEELAIDSIQRFIDRKVCSASSTRRVYWKRDFSSLEKYIKSIERYRCDLRDIYQIPEECLTGKMPKLISETIIHSTEKVSIRKWVLEVCEAEFTIVGLVGIPLQGRKPYPLVVAFHGTASSPEKIFGLDGMEDYHHRFALRLAEQGYMVFAPFTITQLTQNLQRSYNRRRNEIDNRGLCVGVRLLGIELGQMISFLNYASARDDVDAPRIAVYGISLGGLLAFNLGALDQRIPVVIVSQYIEDMVEKFTGRTYPQSYWRYEDSDYIFFQDILLRFSTVDIASLITPRKIFIEVGSQDPRADSAAKTFLEIKTIYDQLKLPSGFVQMEIGKGGHEIFLKGSLQFLKEWLKS
jgi:hypothetical protein